MRVLWLIAILILVGCEAQSTPIASISTSTALPEAQAIRTDTPITLDESDNLVRYGVLSNTIASLPDIEQLTDIAIVETITSDMPLEGYDIVVGYGLYDGWQQTNTQYTVSVIVNRALPPLTNNLLSGALPEIANLPSTLDTIGIQGAEVYVDYLQIDAIETRTLFANAGYPDGISLVIASEAFPALDVIQPVFTTPIIDSQFISLTENTDMSQVHMAFVLWTNENEIERLTTQMTDANVVDLWSMPLSYLADESLVLEFTENGLPIPAR